MKVSIPFFAFFLISSIATAQDGRLSDEEIWLMILERAESTELRLSALRELTSRFADQEESEALPEGLWSRVYRVSVDDPETRVRQRSFLFVRLTYDSSHSEEIVVEYRAESDPKLRRDKLIFLFSKTFDVKNFLLDELEDCDLEQNEGAELISALGEAGAPEVCGSAERALFLPAREREFSSRDSLRAAGAIALANANCPDASSKLIEASNAAVYSESTLLIAIDGALGMLGTPDAVEFLVDRARGDKHNWFTRQWTLTALVDSGSAQAEEVVCEVLATTEESRTIVTAVELLGKLRGSRALDEVVRAVEDRWYLASTFDHDNLVQAAVDLGVANEKLREWSLEHPSEIVRSTAEGFLDK